MEMMDALPNYLKENLRNLRKKFSYSQEELAKKIGLNRGNIASYENGSAEPKICNLLKIANLFKVSILDLTLKDLADEQVYRSASTSFQRNSTSDKELFEQVLEQVNSIEGFINSLNNCQCYKKAAIDKIPQEMEFAFFHFNQLHEATKELIQINKALVEVIHCKL